MTATILVVDDEPDLELLVSHKFRRQIRDGEYKFLFAGDGEEALSTLEDAPEVDLILSDINMPRVDGLTLLGRLILKGKTEGLTVFEPLPADQAQSPATRSYRQVFAKLETGDPGASQAFAALVGQYGEDPLATFYLKRLQPGDAGVEVAFSEK